MLKLVSILIPAYNAERWIAETLKSVLNQSWPRKEIIVVDDGSSDRTFDVARKFQCGILKVVHQENRGASAARNKALAMAQGDYVQWLDADDLLAPDKLSLQLNELGKGCGARTLLSCSFGTFHVCQERSDFVPNTLWRSMDPIEWLTTKFRENVWMSNAVWLVSRVLTERAGKWDERLSLDDDGEYFSRVVAASEYVSYVRDAKVYYRRWHSGSLSRTTSDKACVSLYLSLSASIGHLRRLEDSETTRSACVALLQTWSYYFYQEHSELYDRLCDLARDLGGNLQRPQLGSKYRLLEKLFGWSAAKRIRSSVANAKLLAAYRWEELTHGW